MLCSSSLLMSPLPALSSFQGYPCSLYTYAPVTLDHYPETEQAGSSSEQSSVKEEEVSSRQPSEGTGKAVSRFKYAKKNVESNVVNQCFSYLTTRTKSYPVLARLLQSEEKIDAFYEIMKQAKKKNNKYMGRSVLESLLQLDDDHPVYILHKKLRFRVSLKLNEVRHALRVLTAYFLRSLIVPTILTSSKMDRSTIRQHLTRVREIQRYLSRAASPYC